ncbi:DUF4181 domain-containing protein [Litchfieldia alkalitelluris]|uniref:DUF4181 domain-containing protein n=1 Tax=Litchfieldia alkalitelluris TaxID=304268 RepID=UPI000997FDB5|nr:DUF4181 domain-containing protein [Litchfieldia alkalitelluris]
MITQMFIFLFIAWILSMIIDKLLREKFNIPKMKGMYKTVNSLHKWIERLIVAVFLLGAGFLIFINDPNQNPDTFLIWLLIYFCTLFSVRSWMEWKYQRETNQYIISIYNLVFVLIIIVTSFIFFY